MRHFIIGLHEFYSCLPVAYYVSKKYKVWINTSYFNVRYDYGIPPDSLRQFLTVAEKKDTICFYDGLPVITKTVSVMYATDTTYEYEAGLENQYKQILTNFPDDEVVIVYSTKTNSENFFEFVKANGQIDDDLFNQFKDFKVETRFVYLLWLSGIFVFFSPLLVTLVVFNGKIGLGWAIVTIISLLLGIYFLFRLRRRTRIVYGIIEIVVGVIALMYPMFEHFSSNSEIRFPHYLSILTSIYIIIRGLDNIEVGLKGKLHSYLFKQWDKFF